MSGRLRNVALIGVGAVAGVAVSLGISAYAFRDSRGPIPLEEIRQFTDVFGAIKSQLRRAGRREEADPGRDRRHGDRPRPALAVPRHRSASRNSAEQHPAASSAASASRSAWRTALVQASSRRSRARRPSAPASRPAT
ncbi:MAG: hypothetical protein MZW92_39875 [Comamonadaceae bacterium]|nr:hypothetical protein [Comamonadaceae bacterium]